VVYSDERPVNYYTNLDISSC